MKKSGKGIADQLKGRTHRQGQKPVQVIQIAAVGSSGVKIQRNKKGYQSIAEAEALVNFHPLLCQTDMVQALLKKIKTVTRRLRNLKRINERPDHYTFIGFRWNYDGKKRKQVWCAQFKEPHGFIDNIPFPYGKVGDILWVRENYQILPPNLLFFQADTENTVKKGWKPSIHMPKEACRLFYEITSVRVERLNDITDADAIAEGIARWNNIGAWIKDTQQTGTYSDPMLKLLVELKHAEKFNFKVYRLYGKAANEENYGITDDPKESVMSLFYSINPPKSKIPDDPINNPWVWAIGLKPVSKPINF